MAGHDAKEMTSYVLLNGALLGWFSGPSGPGGSHRTPIHSRGSLEHLFIKMKREPNQSQLTLKTQHTTSVPLAFRL